MEVQLVKTLSVVIVSGVPGVGKSTVIDGALRIVEKKVDVQLVTYGDVMEEIATKRGLVKNRDEMRKLPAKVQRDVQKRAAEKIAKMSKKQLVVVDTHTLILTPEGFLIGLPRWVVEALRPSSLVLIEADPQKIAGRRAKDKTRSRDEQDPKGIDAHQQMCRAASVAVGTLTGATVRIIRNKEGKAEEAAKIFAELLLKV